MKVLTIPLPPIMTNCYVAYEKDGGECFIIDPASNAEKIKTLIELQQLKPKAVLLTHGHFDHIMAADELRDYYSIPLYIHEGDAEMITSPLLNASRGMLGYDVAIRCADRLLKGGEDLKLESETLSVMHTPGHSKGSCSFICKNLIFSGDTMFCGTYGRYDLYGGDFNELMTSIKRLLTLDLTLEVYPGHDQKTTLGSESIYY